MSVIDNKSGYNIDEEPLEPVSLFDNNSPTSDVSDDIVNFTEGNNSNLVSGSTLRVLFGKLLYFINHLSTSVRNIITASATVDSTSGTPSVDVVKTYDGDNVNFQFDFSGLKGADGVTDGDLVDVDNNIAYSGKIKSIGITKSGNAQLFTVGIEDEVSGDEDFVDGFLTVPSGGQNGQVLTKKSGNNYEWDDPEAATPPNITAAATVDDNVGTPGVQVVKTGTDSNPVFTFNFSNLKGASGSPGQPGSDGYSPSISIQNITGGHRITITDEDHPSGQSFDVMDGQSGSPGQPGSDGVTPSITATATADGLSSANPTVVVTKSGTDAFPTFNFAFSGLKGAAGSDGISPTVTVRQTATGHQIEIVSAGGTEQFFVPDGQDGQNGVGVPQGGTAGQVLAKIDGQDFNCEWITPSGGGSPIPEVLYPMSFSSMNSSTGRYTATQNIYSDKNVKLNDILLVKITLPKDFHDVHLDDLMYFSDFTSVNLGSGVARHVYIPIKLTSTNPSQPDYGAAQVFGYTYTYTTGDSTTLANYEVVFVANATYDSSHSRWVLTVTASLISIINGTPYRVGEYMKFNVNYNATLRCELDVLRS